MLRVKARSKKYTGTLYGSAGDYNTSVKVTGPAPLSAARPGPLGVV